MSTEENNIMLKWPTWIGLVVEDLEAQRRYYRDVLGIFDVGSHMFELIAKSSGPYYEHKGFHIGFAVADIEVARVELISRGLEPVGEIQSGAGNSWCYFKDPEGNFYQITGESQLIP